MKRTTLLAILAIAALTLSTPAFAGHPWFGIKVGTNVSKMNFKGNMLKPTSKTGFFAGVTADLKLPIGLGFDIGAMYDMKYLAHEDYFDDNHVWHEGQSQRLHYIDIPLNAKFTLGLGRILGVYVATGPQIAFNVGNKGLFHTDYRLRNSELSWNIGAGVNIIKHLSIGYTYNLPLNSCTTDAKIGDIGDEIWDALHHAKNNSHCISLTYYF